MQVRVNISQVLAAERLAGRLLGGLPDDVLALAQEAADLELATKSYQRRTGTLEDGTEAVMASRSEAGFTVLLRQGAFYGVYVEALGYSMFTEHVARAAVGVDNRIRAIGERLSRA